MEFYKILTQMCLERGLTVNRLCSEVGLSNATATHWKKGAKPSARTISLIAKYFNMSTKELYDCMNTIGYAMATVKVQTKLKAEMLQQDDIYEEIENSQILLQAYKIAPTNIKKAICELLEIDIDIEKTI